MPTIELAVVVEDQLSMDVMRAVLNFANPSFAVNLPVIGRGISSIRTSMVRYRNACNVIPHVVLVDLDQVECAPQLLRDWGQPGTVPGLLLRVAVRETEAWLMADRQGFSRFAGIAMNKLSHAPEAIADPKRALVNLIRRSRNRRLAGELVPELNSRLSIGPLYNERLGQFAREQWDVGVAASLAPSLARTIERLQSFP